MKNKLFFVSSNQAKIREAQHILGFPVEIAKIELEEIQDFEIEKVVAQKTLEAFKQIGKPLIVDDVGFYVEEWNGFPGPFIKYILERGGYELILKMLKSVANRKAYCVSAIGFHDGKKVHIFIGKVNGKIAQEARGTMNLHGFNSIFIPNGGDKTYAEMSLEDKSNISHRKLSLEMFKQYLTEGNIVF